MSRRATKNRPRDGERPIATPRSFEWNGWLFTAALVVAVFLAYMPCWHGGFLLDDDIHLVKNPVLQPGGLGRIWVPGSYINYWPLTFSAYWLQNQLWGLEPLGFHLVNIALHALAALLVWRVLVRLQMPGAMFAAAIFALHPVNVESVAWIAQLKGILSLVFALVSVLFYLGNERKKSGWLYGAAILAYLLSALAKGTAITLPVVLLACAWWQRGRIERRDLLRVVPYFLIGAIMAGIEISSQHFMAAGGLVRTDGLLGRAAVAGCAVWFYLGKLILPINLSPIYPLWTIDESSVASYLPGLLWISLLACAWWRRQTWGGPVIMMIVCYTALLLPVLGFVNITFMQYSLVADHWQYIAMIVPCALFAGCAEMLSPQFLHRRAVISAAGAVLLVLAALSWRQCETYKGAISFYEAAVARNPECVLAQNNLGNALAHHGQFEAAVAHFEKALQLNPDLAEAHTNFAAALADHGQFDAAIAHYRTALQLKPDLAEAHHNLALALDHQGQFDAAIREFEKAEQFKPGLAAIHGSFASVLADHGQLDRAIAEYKIALQIRPDDAAFREKLQAASSDWAKLLKTIDRQHAEFLSRPNDPALLNDIAWTLATNPNNSIRNGAAAVAMAERAEKLSGGNDRSILATLAAAYAEVGRFPDAIRTGEQAERLAKAASDGALLKRLKSCLDLFRNGKPYRQLHGP